MDITNPKVGAAFGAARALLAALGGVVAAFGWVGEDTFNTIAGAALNIGVIGWSAWEKFRVASS